MIVSSKNQKKANKYWTNVKHGYQLSTKMPYIQAIHLIKKDNMGGPTASF